MAIRYSDREVERFHPICQQSLQKALSLTGKANSYCVEHHKHAGGLEMDFAITNRASGKVLCVVEVKRTPSAVKSSRYQYQAMSYIQQLPPALIERPYYIITNIECSCMFKYDASRPNVHQQMLAPGLVGNVDFTAVDDDGELIRLTAEHYARLLATAFNDSGRYLGGFDAIVTMLAGAARHGSDIWSGTVSRFAYEYIRGAMDGVGRDTGLCDIRQYGQNTAALGRAMAHIDFAGIFAAGQCGNSPMLRPGTLADAYALGRANIDADEIVSAVHQIVSEGYEGDGEVPTDIELCRLMAVVARHFMPELHGKACDPAAGSGNILACLCDVYPGISPSQIKANDKKAVLQQLLTLRLGLKFPTLITPDNAPSVSARSIETLPCSYFSDVSLIMLNPPMVASISCGGERRRIYDRIRALGREPVTEAGQPPLEAAFMELTNTLAADGTLTVALLPRTHLTAQGSAAVALRRFLLGDFGLSLVFNYPGTGLFENVTKDTVMVAGIKGARPAQITMMYTIDTVADTDLAAAAEMLDSGRRRALRRAGVPAQKPLGDGSRHRHGLEHQRLARHRDCRVCRTLPRPPPCHDQTGPPRGKNTQGESGQQRAQRPAVPLARQGALPLTGAAIRRAAATGDEECQVWLCRSDRRRQHILRRSTAPAQHSKQDDRLVHRLHAEAGAPTPRLQTARGHD